MFARAGVRRRARPRGGLARSSSRPPSSAGLSADRRRSREPVSVAAAIVVVAFGLFLIAFSGVAFAKPAAAERFVTAFASSARTHYSEQVVRLLIGAALVVRSPIMWQPGVFRPVGWAILVGSAVLLCVPWRWHHRLGERVLPLLVRRLRLYAAGSLAFGALLLCGVFAGGRAA